MKKGKLVRVEIAKGQFRKMYEADAIAAGLIKARPPAQNKMQVPAENKSADPAPEPEERPQADDFTVIPGVGQATARALVAHGIATFDELRDAGKLDYLSEKANQAIQDWRDG